MPLMPCSMRVPWMIELARLLAAAVLRRLFDGGQGLGAQAQDLAAGGLDFLHVALHLGQGGACLGQRIVFGVHVGCAVASEIGARCRTEAQIAFACSDG